MSCIYGIGNPEDFENGIVRIKRGQTLSRQGFLLSLVNSLYTRDQFEFKRGSFRVQGDTIDINLPYLDYGYRITFFGDQIEEIESFEMKTGKRIMPMDKCGCISCQSLSRPQRNAHPDSFGDTR